MIYYLPPSFRRQGVVAGFVLRRAFTTETRTVTREGAGPEGEPVTWEEEVEMVVPSLVPMITIGVLFASGEMYRPAEAPTLPAMAANARKNLYYNHVGGWYWGDEPLVSGDAFVGWAKSDGEGVIVTSSRRIGIGVETVPVLSGEVAGPEGAPPLPYFGTGSALPGFFTLSGLGFEDLAGTLSITTGTFVVYWVGESQAAEGHVAVDMSEFDESITVDAWGEIEEGSLIEIEGEMLRVGAIDGLTAEVARARAASSTAGIAAAHATGAEIRLVSSLTATETFPPGFFSGIGTASVNPLLVAWEKRIPLPNARVLATDGFVSNPQGDSPVYSANYTHNDDVGVLTGSPVDLGPVVVTMRGVPVVY